MEDFRRCLERQERETNERNRKADEINELQRQVDEQVVIITSWDQLRRSMILSSLGPLLCPHGFVSGNSRATSQWVIHPEIALALNSLNFRVPTIPKPVSSQKASCYMDAGIGSAVARYCPLWGPLSALTVLFLGTHEQLLSGSPILGLL
ncbi:hypothetical protein L3X38_014137 [Prunus dulcis]|uniref:Uncharacterized protein n=1 Tax=Prunus dulcis TaxID=3755 RepID=A0AAD4WN76_PRUDU|nr:hypothetical protein L3X38_014137 [Prunus dulcis]